MKFRINKTALINAVSQVSKAVSQKTTIPILTGIKAVLDEQGLYLTGSNSDITIQVFVPTKEEDQEQLIVENTGSVVLPGKIFTDIIRKLPGDQVEWEVNDAKQVFIESQQAKFELIGLDADEFPRLPHLSMSQSFRIHTNVLRTMIRQTHFAVSQDEAKVVLTGVLWKLQSGTLTFVATDGHRLAKREAPITGSNDFSLTNTIVPGKSMVELAKTISDIDEEVEIFVADHQLLVKTERMQFFTRLIEGKYPETEDFIPRDWKTKVVGTTRDLMESVDRASLINRAGHDHVVKWTIKEANIEITSVSHEIGKVTEKINVQIDGSPLEISFNPRYMMDALRSIDHEDIMIQFKGAMAPFTIQPKENQDTLYLILPIRTHS